MSRREDKILCKLAKKVAFSHFEKSKKNADGTWQCCDGIFTNSADIHKHIALQHQAEVENAIPSAKESLQKPSPGVASDHASDMPEKLTREDVYPWLPHIDQATTSSQPLADQPGQDGRILLFYKYRDIPSPQHVVSWQRELCSRLDLTGKIRVAREGVNATVGGTHSATGIYITSVMAHPWFNTMIQEHFKESGGSAADFPDGCKVGVYEEIVPMGVKPEAVSYREAGKHLTPDEFHQALTEDKTKQSESILLDCRNFYEGKIGHFTDAVIPDIRKFSYWPEYVDKNLNMFRDKNVYMYCTGGIRCERGSAYLKSKGVCRDVYQLQGGIHKYLERYPDGLYRGKLFVFDNRYAISSNDDIVSGCFYCSQPYDSYAPCSSSHCHQLVLICGDCRSSGHTTCCPTCKHNIDSASIREECDCTQHRPRIPHEKIS